MPRQGAATRTTAQIYIAKHHIVDSVALACACCHADVVGPPGWRGWQSLAPHSVRISHSRSASARAKRVDRIRCTNARRIISLLFVFVIRWYSFIRGIPRRHKSGDSLLYTPQFPSHDGACRSDHNRGAFTRLNKAPDNSRPGGALQHLFARATGVSKPTCSEYKFPDRKRVAI